MSKSYSWQLHASHASCLADGDVLLEFGDCLHKPILKRHHRTIGPSNSGRMASVITDSSSLMDWTAAWMVGCKVKASTQWRYAMLHVPHSSRIDPFYTARLKLHWNHIHVVSYPTQFGPGRTSPSPDTNHFQAQCLLHLSWLIAGTLLMWWGHIPLALQSVLHNMFKTSITCTSRTGKRCGPMTHLYIPFSIVGLRPPMC